MALGVLTIYNSTRTVKVGMNEGFVQPSQGLGGWQEVQRPRRDSITEWQGRAPFRLSLPILFDKFREDESVEAGIAALEAMALPLKDTNGKIIDDPPPVTIEGAIPHAELQWVIDSIDWAEYEWNTAGNRTRQAAMLNLLEYIPGPRFGIPTQQHYRQYLIKKGDTPGKIAAKPIKLGGLHNRRRWKQIRDLNPKFKIHNADQKLPVGKKLRMPLK